MKDRAIGVFDSGVGGLTCAKELLQLVPNENMIYLQIENDEIQIERKNISLMKLKYNWN